MQNCPRIYAVVVMIVLYVYRMVVVYAGVLSLAMILWYSEVAIITTTVTGFIVKHLQVLSVVNVQDQ